MHALKSQLGFRIQSGIDTVDAVDLTHMTELANGDPAIIQELVTTFLSDYPNTMRVIGRAIQARDAKILERAAHNLKGSLALFGAGPAKNFAAKLERLGRDSVFDQAPPVLRRLEAEMGRIRSALLEPSDGLERLSRRFLCSEPPTLEHAKVLGRDGLTLTRRRKK